MARIPDILEIAQKRPVMADDLELVEEKERVTPGAVQYVIRRYRKQPDWSFEDTGVLNYQYRKSSESAPTLELKFCIAGNVYCNGRNFECEGCKAGISKNCSAKEETMDVMSFTFYPEHLQQYLNAHRSSGFTNQVLSFNHTSSFAKILPLCSRTRMVLEGLLNNTYTESLENIYINAQTQMLLLYSLECMLGEKEEDVTFSCKFLANDTDRDKIINARDILLKHIGEPITIKELSRKVAINECYLKKGFKEIFGTTIFDFYQSQRMEHAKYLLYEKGLSVTDVSLMLGYSSISHFSTAFKKHTGLKPCELLFR
ncbi:MAG: helix-turn-helix transcriptional regulator [Sphingobacteriales bacterium]|nr:helix-turn-helix transcriptional regulator [Sphingobacteriales bacterium]OJY87226.1 MAG: AraC family transcriptional regulator [Sphingobacteriales bacterium 44-15]